MIFQIVITVFSLVAVSLILLFLVCAKKGILSLLSLLAAVFLFLFFAVPLIAKGYDPIWVVFIVSMPIMALIIYSSEGFTELSNLSIISTLFCFLISCALAYYSVKYANFSGIVSEEASIAGEAGINLQKVLIAGIMVSTLGALIELIMTQVATTIGFYKSGIDQGIKVIYEKAYQVGVVHLCAIISTLFLIYAGVSLPLLIIVSGPNLSVANVLGYEPLSTEIVRMLAGVISLIIAMPISTFFTAWWLERKFKKNVHQ